MSRPFYLNWWEREEAEQNCEHWIRSVHCERCGAFLGTVCDYCGMEGDGGDHMADEPDCTCEEGPLVRSKDDEEWQE